jgi:hypothetical protein
MKESLNFRLGIHVDALLRIIVCIGAAFWVSNAAAVIGYIIDPIPPGDVLIANQLSNGTDTLNSLFRTNLAPSIPDGTSFTKWDSTAGAFLPVSYYEASSDSWSLNYTLTYGEGGLLHSAGSTWTNIFVGEVYPGFGLGTFNWNPNYSDGLHLISSPVPISGTVSSMFSYIVGRAPHNGETVTVLDSVTKINTTATYDSLNGLWDNNPNIGISQAVWVNLGPVPEPSVMSLLALAGLAFSAVRRWRR